MLGTGLEPYACVLMDRLIGLSSPRETSGASRGRMAGVYGVLRKNGVQDEFFKQRHYHLVSFCAFSSNCMPQYPFLYTQTCSGGEFLILFVSPPDEQNCAEHRVLQHV